MSSSNYTNAIVKKRIEKDSLGEIKVDSTKLWGAQTQRSLQNFVIGNETMPLDLIYAIVIVKIAATKANCQLKKLNVKTKDLIINVGQQILKGKYDNQFPLKVWQTGSGTQTNMNVNEVIAHLAKNNIHPNDHVNMSQSSNDVFPSAMHIAIVTNTIKYLLPNLTILITSLERLEKKYRNVIKIGRTHLQDATPITLGQEISAWKESLKKCSQLIKQTLPLLFELPLGGTAVGTGLNAPKNFDKLAINEIARITKIGFKPASNKFVGIAFKESVCAIHAQFKVLATTLYKIANDIRFLSSGPRAGIGELILSANEPGSSIMPGKVNPTQCEAMMMVCTQVFGYDTTISFATSQGNFELNTFMPVIIHDVLSTIKLLSDAMHSFVNNCINGISINKEQINKHLENSLMLVTALSPKIGYTKAATIAKYAYKHNVTLKEAAIALKYVDAKTFDHLVNPNKMV